MVFPKWASYRGFAADPSRRAVGLRYCMVVLDIGENPYWDDGGQEVISRKNDLSARVDRAERSSQTTGNTPLFQVGDQVDGKIVSIRQDFAWVKLSDSGTG